MLFYPFPLQTPLFTHTCIARADPLRMWYGGCRPGWDRRRRTQVWWVQRTLYNFRVQARKPLTVTSPTCTFDSTNGQYYPYAMLDEEGVAID